MTAILFDFFQSSAKTKLVHTKGVRSNQSQGNTVSQFITNGTNRSTYQPDLPAKFSKTNSSSVSNTILGEPHHTCLNEYVQQTPNTSEMMGQAIYCEFYSTSYG